MPDALVDINSQLPWLLPTAAALYGAIIGSFLNVCILRIPAGRSIVRPGSSCACGKPIAWYDNIPVLSWFLLRGRARCCGRRFSFRYPAIELLTAGCFLACWLLFPPGKALCGMLLISALICATFIDLDHMIIPDVFTIGLAVAGLVLSFAVPSLHGYSGDIFMVESVRSGISSIIGMLIGSGLLLWIALFAESILKKEAMGGGDIKLVGAIGAFMGWQGTLTTIFGGAIVGTLWFLIALVIQTLFGRKAPKVIRSETPEGKVTDLGLGAQIPFGPMLAIAAVFHFLWLHRFVEPYFEQIQDLFSNLSLL